MLSVHMESFDKFIFSSNGEGNRGLGGIRCGNEVLVLLGHALVLLGHAIPIGGFIGMKCREFVWHFRLSIYTFL